MNVGDIVKLKSSVRFGMFPEGREDNPTAKIVEKLDPAIPGGVVLDRDLGGMKWWNEENLRLVRKAK
jgi:hypothetical protein